MWVGLLALGGCQRRKQCCLRQHFQSQIPLRETWLTSWFRPFTSNDFSWLEWGFGLEHADFLIHIQGDGRSAEFPFASRIEHDLLWLHRVLPKWPWSFLLNGSLITASWFDIVSTGGDHCKLYLSNLNRWIYLNFSFDIILATCRKARFETPSITRVSKKNAPRNKVPCKLGYPFIFSLNPGNWHQCNHGVALENNNNSD